MTEYGTYGAFVSSHYPEVTLNPVIRMADKGKGNQARVMATLLRGGTHAQHQEIAALLKAASQAKLNRAFVPLACMCDGGHGAMSALAAAAYTGIVLTIALVVSARLHPARSRRARVLYVLVQCAEYVLLIMAAVGIAVAAITGEH